MQGIFSGQKNVHEKPGRRRPSISDEIVGRVEALVREDLTVKKIFKTVPDVSKTTVDKILTENLKYHKTYARWESCMMSDDHKRKRVDSSPEFLRRCEEGEEEFLLLLEIIASSSPYKKKHLEGMHFVSDEEITATVNKFLRENSTTRE